MATPVLAVQALTKDDTIDPVFMPGSLTPAGSFSFTPNGSASGCSCAGAVTARYSNPMPGVTAGARAASPRPAMLLCPIKKRRSTVFIKTPFIKTRKFTLCARCADTFCLCRCHGNRRSYLQRAVFSCAFRNSMQPVWQISKLYRTEVPNCNRKLYSPVLSCTHHGKIPAEKTFLCFADKMRFVFAFLVFYLFSIYLCRLFLYRRNPSGQSLHRKSRSWAKASEAGNLGRYIAGRVSRRCDCECAQTGAFLAATGAVCGDVVE